MRKIRKSDRATGLLSVILVAVVAALLLTSIPAYAGNQMGQVTKQAEVVGVDPAAQQITVRLLEGDDLTISVDKNTRVMFCTEPQYLDALKKGDSVTITYRENPDGFYADGIDLTVEGFTKPDATAC